jgi:hypothetical protein
MAPVMHLFLAQMRPHRLFLAMAGMVRALLEGRPNVEAKVVAWPGAVAEKERANIGEEGGAWIWTGKRSGT